MVPRIYLVCKTLMIIAKTFTAEFLVNLPDSIYHQRFQTAFLYFKKQILPFWTIKTPLYVFSYSNSLHLFLWSSEVKGSQWFICSHLSIVYLSINSIYSLSCTPSCLFATFVQTSGGHFRLNTCQPHQPLPQPAPSISFTIKINKKIISPSAQIQSAPFLYFVHTALSSSENDTDCFFFFFEIFSELDQFSTSLQPP